MFKLMNSKIGKPLFASILMLLPVSEAVNANPINDWRQAVAQKVAKKHIYPRSAIRKEIEGRAIVKVTIERTGTIAKYDIIEATGEEVLDKVIPKMLSRVDPFPAPPSDLADENLTFLVPLTWRLR